MVKGCQKKIIHVKDTGSELFSEAYFILTGEADGHEHTDLVREAPRLLSSDPWDELRDRPQWRRWIAPFLTGFLACGIAVLLCLWLL